VDWGAWAFPNSHIQVTRFESHDIDDRALFRIAFELLAVDDSSLNNHFRHHFPRRQDGFVARGLEVRSVPSSSSTSSLPSRLWKKYFVMGRELRTRHRVPRKQPTENIVGYRT
jgi:hypothetical protein